MSDDQADWQLRVDAIFSGMQMKLRLWGSVIFSVTPYFKVQLSLLKNH